MPNRHTYTWELEGRATRLADVPQGATVIGIDGKSVAGRCRKCRRWIAEGTPYNCWAEGISCLRCGP